MSKGTGSGLHLRPTKASRFLYVAATPEAVARVVSSFLFGVMSDVHGSSLKKHISCTPRQLRWDELLRT